MKERTVTMQGGPLDGYRITTTCSRIECMDGDIACAYMPHDDPLVYVLHATLDTSAFPVEWLDPEKPLPNDLWRAV